ncbi:hypothetical protein F5X96DRAFT_669295 [Biscogniauxia mediterranea]|nr:hypothetical protein F5X96DRAFT_669295 [Biscogniauxia mediterranea]
MKLLLGVGLLLQVVACLYVPTSLPKQPDRPLKWLELSQFDFKPYILTDMCVDCRKDHRDDPLFDCSIEFGWKDPNANTTCVCEYQWQWSSANTTSRILNTGDMDYLKCEAKTKQLDYFQFKFETMFNPSNFTLMLSHLFKDYKDFPTPELANLFAERNITLAPLESSDTSLVYFQEGPIEARIMGATI